MSEQTSNEATYHQTLRFGTIEMERADPNPTSYMLAGQHMYVLGTTDGAFRPIGDEHIVGLMGGFWAHPVRFADGWFVNVYEGEEATRLDDCRHSEGHMSDIVFRFEHGPLRLLRTDFVVEDERAVVALLELRNTGETPWQGRIGFEARIHFRGSWFSGLQCGVTEAWQDNNLVLGFDREQPTWGCAFGGMEPPSEIVHRSDGDRIIAETRHDIALEPGGVRHLEVLFVADHRDGPDGARATWHRLTGTGADLLAQKRARYEQIAFEGVTLDVPDREIIHEYQLAKLNVHMLSADYRPYLPPYLLAGIPEYPQLFGCDTAYSIPGITAAGFASIARSALDALGDVARRACGRVPHEVTTNGRVWHPGNTQETPQWTLAVWEYVRWTGDLDYLRTVYPLCREGVMEYLPAHWDGDGDGYPDGDAMIERRDMGALKLDSACYLYAAWHALAEMATVLGRPEATAYQDRARDWRDRFERDWWIEDQQLYADSLHADLQPQLDGHWTQIVPVQLGIAEERRARIVLEEVERSFVNHNGMVHTRGREARVWTLPTGLLALAQLRYGHGDEAVTQLHNIARTTQHGMLGSFKELIPQGICFVQLWSPALFMQGIVEGLLGLAPRAYERVLRLHPRIPKAWPAATLRHLRIGDHVVTVEVTHDHTTITSETGAHPLVIEFVGASEHGQGQPRRIELAPGATVNIPARTE